MRNPFGTINIKPVRTVQVADRWVWFAAKGAIDPATNPVSLQEKQRKQASITLMILQAAEKLAALRGISPEDARALFFNQDGVSENILDYLSPEQKTDYFALAQEAADIPIASATLMIQNRILYDVVITADAKPKSKQLQIAEPWFDIEVGSYLKTLGGGYVRVTEPYDSESSYIGVEPLPQAIKADDVLFLMESRSQYKMGNPSWSDSDTLHLTLETADGSKSQIQAIYEFYLRECGRLADGNDEESEGKALESKLLNSIPTSEVNPSIGENSIGESNPTESQTADLNTKTLEPALIG